MKLGLNTTKYPHMMPLMAKIMHLIRVLNLSKRRVLLYSNDPTINFIVFIAAFIANRHLTITNRSDDVWKIITMEDIGILIDADGDCIVNSHTRYDPLDMKLYINSNGLFRSSYKSNQWLAIERITTSLQRKYFSIGEISFTEEAKLFRQLCLARLRNDSPKYVLSLFKGTDKVLYSIRNILLGLDAIDGEFKDTKDIYASTYMSTFEETFLYQLYFFLRGDLVDMGNHTVKSNILLKSPKLKKLFFVSDDTFQSNWNNSWKYKLYNRFNRFLNRWKLTKWITMFTYQEIMGMSKNSEYILINPTLSLDKAQFLDKTRTKVSVIYGTFADSYTLSINRYDDKELKIVNNSYRIMDQNKSINLETDTIGRLYLGGKRIPYKLRTKHAIKSKSGRDKYYLNEDYCNINGEILTLTANAEDIYYDEHCNVISDIGTKKQAIMSIPYIKRADIIKIEGLFKLVVELDTPFIKKTFEHPTYTTVTTALRNKVHEINCLFVESELIHTIAISGEFFKEYDGVKHIISKKNFIEYLNTKHVELSN